MGDERSVADKGRRAAVTEDVGTMGWAGSWQMSTLIMMQQNEEQMGHEMIYNVRGCSMNEVLESGREEHARCDAGSKRRCGPSQYRRIMEDYWGVHGGFPGVGHGNLEPKGPHGPMVLSSERGNFRLLVDSQVCQSAWTGAGKLPLVPPRRNSQPGPPPMIPTPAVDATPVGRCNCRS